MEAAPLELDTTVADIVIDRAVLCTECGLPRISGLALVKAVVAAVDEADFEAILASTFGAPHADRPSGMGTDEPPAFEER
jgi:hypothetical protein